jgi:hypothetical protein
MALGVAFYALVYAPLLAEVTSLTQSSTMQLKERDLALAKLRAELATNQGRRETPAIGGDSEAAAAVHGAQTAITSRPASPAQRTREQREPTPVKTEAKHVAVAKPVDAQAERSAREQREHAAQEAETKGGVDRAAAAAATAALEAQAYTGHPPAAKTASDPGPSRPTPIEAEPAAKPSADRVAPAVKQAVPIEPKAAHPSAVPESAGASEKKDPLSGMERGSSDDPLEGL